jgi:acyl carrier protein
MTLYEEIENSIIEIIAQITNNIKVDANTTQIDCPGWDSLGFLVIISEVESKFSVNVGVDFFDQMNSVKNISNFVYSEILKKGI